MGSGSRDAEAFLEDKVFGALGEPLGDDLSVERVGEYLRPIFEWAVGSDAGRAAVVVALGDNLEGELGLGGVHGEHREVVNDEELGADEATKGTLEQAVELGAMQLAEHAGRGDEDNAPRRETGLVRERTSKERLAGPRRADEERVDAFVEEVEIVKGEVSSAELFARGIEVEVERVDGVDLGESRVAKSSIDGALDSTLFFLVAEAVNDVCRREILFGRAFEDREFLSKQIELVARSGIAVVALLHGDSSLVGGSPGSRVIGVAKRSS